MTTAVFYTGKMLAFDQSLASTGWASVVSDAVAQTLTVEQVGMTPTSPGDVTGFEDSFQRGVVLYHEMSSIMWQYQPDLVIHEMPVARVQQTRNREAPFVSAMAVRCAAELAKRPVRMVSAQKVKKRLTGSAKADKQQVRAALLDTPNVLGLDRERLNFWNSDVFDAIALAVVFATDTEQE